MKQGVVSNTVYILMAGELDAVIHCPYDDRCAPLRLFSPCVGDCISADVIIRGLPSPYSLICRSRVCCLSMPAHALEKMPSMIPMIQRSSQRTGARTYRKYRSKVSEQSCRCCLSLIFFLCFFLFDENKKPRYTNNIKRALWSGTYDSAFSALCSNMQAQVLDCRRKADYMTLVRRGKCNP